MGYVPMTCHICEGPADLSKYEIEQGDMLPNSEAQGRVEWMTERVGITETNGPSAQWDRGADDPDPVVRKAGSGK